MQKKILAIHAHPDDIEILAGGTVAALAHAGHQVVMATMTAGDCGSVTQGADEIARIRAVEAANSAALIQAQYHCLGFKDMAIFSDHPSRQRVTELLRVVRPDIIITASPEDYMADHEATSALVRDACFAAPLPNYVTGTENPAAHLPEIPALYYMDPIGGRDRNGAPVIPDFVVNVEGTLETKAQMLSEHRSQLEWLRHHHGVENYISSMRRWTAERGSLVGISAGEGFRHYIGHPYPEDPRLESLFEGLFRP